MFQEAFHQCVKNFGENPRHISLWDRLTYWRVVRPDWLYESPNDELETIFLNLAQLRRDGVVVWGHIIQANNLLFSPGGGDCPGEVVYSLDRTMPVDPEELGSVADAIGSLKHTKPSDPDLASIADYLTNEWMRVYGKPVPATISPNREYKISTVYVVRKHLPKPSQSLERPFLPILVLPEPPHVALVLPSRYWPQVLIDWWRGG
ncbi:MAG: hypothetical protein JNL58_26935 [Planctomyces sp.]|nr:hypothetical protein [Planctomyces sp.]